MNIKNYILIIFILINQTSVIYGQITVVNEGNLFIADSQSFYVQGSFSNYSDGFENYGHFSLTGDFLNEGKIWNTNSGKLNFIGNQQQWIYLLDSTELYAASISNPSGLILSGPSDLRIFGEFNFLNGVVFTDQGSILSFQSGSSTVNSDEQSYIDGPALKYGKGDFLFPFGKGGDYRPAAIFNMTDTATIRMEYFNFSNLTELKESGIEEVNREGYWNIQRTDGVGLPKLRLFYDETSNLFSDPNSIGLVHWKGFWGITPSEPAFGGPDISVSSQQNLNSFGQYTTAQLRIAVPEITSFIGAQNSNCHIVLKWSMAPGADVDKYEIEYSYDGSEFYPAGEVPGDSLATTDFETYQFVDDNLHEETSVFYRIKINAKNNVQTFIFSPEISIENNCIFTNLHLFPNPLMIHEDLNLHVTNYGVDEIRVEIWDHAGRFVFGEEIGLVEGSETYTISTSKAVLLPGTYRLHIGETRTLNFIVAAD